MIETGFLVFLGVALILWKLPRRWMLRALHHDVALDLLVSVLVLVIHWQAKRGQAQFSARPLSGRNCPPRTGGLIPAVRVRNKDW